MPILIIAVILVIFALLLIVLGLNLRQTRNDPGYFQITILLGSGGHTGEISRLFQGFHFKKTNKINILITETDQSSLNFFTSSLKNCFGEDYNILESKLHIHYVKRTNQVKQSYVSAVFSGIKALFSSVMLIFNHLLHTTHFISNGPGTCVPFFYLFFALKSLRVSRVKLIFIESWCRVQDLSLSGKLVKPIVDDFIVHWPELAKKYKKCKYYGKII